MMSPLNGLLEPLRACSIIAYRNSMVVSVFASIPRSSLVNSHQIQPVSTNELRMSYLGMTVFSIIPRVAQVVPTAAQYTHKGMKHKVPQHKWTQHALYSHQAG